MTTAELRTQLEAGKSLATIATDNGKTADGLKAALTTAAKKDLDAAVTAGRLTQAQEDKLLAALPARLDHEINEAHTGGPGGPGGPPPAGPVEHRSDGLTLAELLPSDSTTPLPPLRAPAGPAASGARSLSGALNRAWPQSSSGSTAAASDSCGKEGHADRARRARARAFIRLRTSRRTPSCAATSRSGPTAASCSAPS